MSQQPQQQSTPPGLVLASRIEAMKADLARVIPKHLNADRMIRLAQASMKGNRGLWQCSIPSVLVGVMQAATLGLELDVLGEAYLIPFKGNAVLVPGYKGLIKLAHRGGVVAGFQTGIVRERDDFDYGLGSDPFVTHKPSINADPDDPQNQAIAYYSVAKLKSGFAQVTILSRKMAEKAKASSPSGRRNDSPWNTHFDEMAVKTCVRRGAKMLPLTPELSRVIEYDERREKGEPVVDMFEGMEEAHKLSGDVPRELPQGSVDALAGKLGVPPDDIKFETAEEEKARIAREKREPGQEG